ncbi:MAG: HAMP domain-containing sensor histidine kinase [Planctomycetota bacterium]
MTSLEEVLSPGEGAPPPAPDALEDERADGADAREEDAPGALSLRLQLTIWFGLSFFVILLTVVAAVIVIDRGRIFDRSYQHYHWLVRMMGTAFLTALLGGLAASWVIVGAALDPLRRITESVQDVAPESIEAKRIAVPEVGAEVNEAKRALNSALDRIEAGYRAQERFISNVSHELKTPIAVVFTEAQRLAKGARSADELQTFVGEIADQMGKLAAMVESFLTLARIDYEARLKKNGEFWFHDLVVEAAGRNRAQGETLGVSIDVELPDEFEFFDTPTWGDPELVSSLVGNLIRNALRFSPPDGNVRVTLEPGTLAVAGEDGPARDAAVIRVVDRGPGIPAEIVDTLFEPFAQAKAERRAERGTGLGLAIAKKVADLHRGTIQALNRTDGESGCVVEVRLPFLTEEDWSADRDVLADLEGGAAKKGS